MTKAQQMLAMAGFPDTAEGRASFHKLFPTPEDFFKLFGIANTNGPINPENVILKHYPGYQAPANAEESYKRGGPIMYGNGGGTKVYSTFDQSTNQTGNSYANNITSASTNIDPNGNTSQQFVRQTTNPNQTPYMRYFNDEVLGSEMNIAGANGNNMFIKPDPMMDNFLKTRTNYMSGAMAGEQMKRNGGMIKYAAGGVTGGGEDEEVPQGYKKSKRGYYDPIEGATTQFQGAQDYFKGWFNSPIYKQIIQKQADALYGDDNKKKTKFIDRTINSNINNWKDFTENPYLKENLRDTGIFGVSGATNLHNSSSTLDLNFVKNNPTLANSLYAHELAHRQGMEPFATPYDYSHVKELTPAFNPAIHKPGGRYDENGVWHDVVPAEDLHFMHTEPDEVRTEIHAVRQLAKQAGVYDPYTESFTKEHLDKIEKLFNEGGPDGKNFNQLGRLRKHFSDESVIDMMNTISQNKNNTQGNDNIQMAAVGGMVDVNQLTPSMFELSGSPPDEEEALMNARLGVVPDRFPKQRPKWSPPGYVWWGDRDNSRNVKTVNPHQKEAKPKRHKPIGSCVDGRCFSFEDGGTVDALQLMGMPTPPMYGMGGSATPMYNVGGFTNPDEPTNPNDMSLFSMVHSKPNRYFETKQEGDKYFVQQRGDFPLSNQQFKNWNSPSPTFSGPNQLNEWHSIGANEYNKLNSQAVNGRIGYQTYAQGGHVTNYIPSYNFGHVQSKNNTYRHGFGYGGPIGKYDFGSTIKDIGAGAYGALEGTLDTVTMGATDSLTDAGYKGLQKLGNSTDAEIRQQDSIKGYGQLAGSIAGGFTNPAALGTAISEGSQGLGQGIAQGSPGSKTAQQIGQGITMAGGIAGMATGMGAFGTPGSGAAGLAQTKSFNASDFGKFAGKAGKVGQGFNVMNSGNPMQMMQMFGQPHAMGGAVNAPNMMKYDDGGMTQQGPTQINVERGELLVDKDGRILTEYRGGGMVPHPSDGSMDDRGTVPAQEGQFVITKKLAPSYKSAMENNDKLYADAMRNNISFDKQRKEAKEQEQQARAQQMMMAKFGGMIGQYGYGGGIMKFDGGAGVPGSFDYMNQYLAGVDPNNASYPLFKDPSGSGGYTYSFNPTTNKWVTYKPGSNKALSLDKFPTTINLLNQSYGDTGEGLGIEGQDPYSFDATSKKFAKSVAQPPQPPQPPQPIQCPPNYAPNADGTGCIPLVRMPGNNDDSDEGYNEDGSYYDQSSGNKGSRNNNSKFGMLGQALQYSPALYNLGRGIFEKADKVNPEDYMVKNRIKPYEEQYRPDYRPYNAMIYGMNRNPNSDSLAGKVNLFNTAQHAYADEKYKVNQASLGRRMQADQANANIDQFNANVKWQGDIWNKQALAKKRDFIGKGFEQGSLAYQNERNAFLYGNSLKDLTANYDWVNGRWVPKTKTS